MDIATIIGMAAGFGVVLAAIFMGGSITQFINAPSIVIVIGGAISATILRFPLSEVAGALITGAKTAFTTHKTTPRALLDEIRKLADVSRAQGPIALEGVEIDDPFLARGKQMVADGIEAARIREQLELARDLEIQRLVEGEKIFKSIAAAAPAFGMIGTLVGLVAMLSTMDDPSTIGPSMAVALLTTLYGALVQNIIADPIADKLASKLEMQETNLALIIDGLCQLAERKSADVITDMLIVYLPEKQRAGLIEE